MRKELKCIIWAHVGLIVYLLYLSFDLLSLLNDDIFSDALLDVEINPNPSTSLNKPAIIPKIIHQTYKTTDIPEIWKPGQQACINLHQDDYQYFLWTDESAREFINKEFNWFIDTWDNYKYPIQRADAIRYFALYYYGGIYIDLDDGCKRKLDPLLTVPAFVRKTAPTGISNDVMGSVPNHPFFLKVIQDLEKYQRNWLVPYITIMMSTGPLFLSIMWKQYKRWGVPEAGKVRILLPQNYKGTTSSYFAIVRGSSWHMGDANFIKSLGDHLVLAVIGGFLLGLLILFVEYLFYSWVISSQCKRLTSKLLSFTWAILMGVLRFFHLDKLLSKCDFWSRSTKYEEMLLPKDSNDLKNINNNNTSNNNTNGGDSNNNDKSDYNNNDNNNNNINNHTGKTRLSSIFNILGGKTKVKRRNRKDSNLPIEIDVLSKLLDDTVIIDASTTETPTNPVSPTPSPISPTINSRTSNNELLIPTNNNNNNNNNDNDEEIEMKQLNLAEVNSKNDSNDSQNSLHFDSGSCAICLEIIEDEDIVRGLICGHVFHAECLDPWLIRRRACCPMCKRDYLFKRDYQNHNGNNNNTAENTNTQNDQTNNNNSNEINEDDDEDDDDLHTIDFDIEEFRNNPSLQMMLQELIPPAERVRILLEDPRYSDLNFEERAREIAKRKYSNIFKIIWWKIMGISKLDFYHWGVLKLIEKHHHDHPEGTESTTENNQPQAQQQQQQQQDQQQDQDAADSASNSRNTHEVRSSRDMEELGDVSEATRTETVMNRV